MSEGAIHAVLELGTHIELDVNARMQDTQDTALHRMYHFITYNVPFASSLVFFAKLLVAIQKNNCEMAAILLYLGAKRNVKNKKGVSPLNLVDTSSSQIIHLFEQYSTEVLRIEALFFDLFFFFALFISFSSSIFMLSYVELSFTYLNKGNAYVQKHHPIVNKMKQNLNSPREDGKQPHQQASQSQPQSSLHLSQANLEVNIFLS